jgi:inner membrane protein
MVAVAVGTAAAPRRLLRPFLVTGAICAVIPDLDAIGRWTGGGDVAWLGGHRGFTHSLPFAALAGSVAAIATMRDRRWRDYRLRFGLFVAIVTAAHGALDAFTSIGAVTSPVQFFSPYSAQGYVSPWQPIHGPFSELFYCLLPLVGFTRLMCHVRAIPWPRARSATQTLNLRT